MALVRQYHSVFGHDGDLKLIRQDTVHTLKSLKDEHDIHVKKVITKPYSHGVVVGMRVSQRNVKGKIISVLTAVSPFCGVREILSVGEWGMGCHIDSYFFDAPSDLTEILDEAIASVYVHPSGPGKYVCETVEDKLAKAEEIVRFSADKKNLLLQALILEGAKGPYADSERHAELKRRCEGEFGRNLPSSLLQFFIDIPFCYGGLAITVKEEIERLCKG